MEEKRRRSKCKDKHEMPDELVNIGELIVGPSIVLERMLLENSFLLNMNTAGCFIQ